MTFYASLKHSRPTSSSKRAMTPGGAAIEQPRRIVAEPAFLASDLGRAACPDGIAFRRLVLPRIVRRRIVSGRNTRRPRCSTARAPRLSCRKSILNTNSKVMERLVLARLVPHLTKSTNFNQVVSLSFFSLDSDGTSQNLK